MTTERHDAYAIQQFVCQRRNGSTAVVPRGSCVIEEGPYFAAICWVTATGRGRAEITFKALRHHIEQGHIAYKQAWRKQA
jgi:hypothetical protein